MHARVTPAENVFRYGVCFYLLDLDELPALDRQLALFGWNRPNVVTYRDSDHLDVRCAASTPTGYLLLTNLRVLGYVFNPVSFWYCYRAGELTSIVAEVSNTFGEKLPVRALAREPGRRRRRRFSYEHDKRLHVSPFFPLDQEVPLVVHRAGRRGERADRRLGGRRAAVLGDAARAGARS